MSKLWKTMELEKEENELEERGHTVSVNRVG